MLNPALLADPVLLLVMVFSALVSLLGGLNVAARPAAVITGRVAQATTVSSLFFLVSRLANMFYLPLMAGFVGAAADTQRALQQVQWVVIGCAAGSFVGWLMLANFVNLFNYMVEQLDTCGIKSFLRPSVIAQALRSFSQRYPMPARLGQLQGIPAGFLCFNVFATSVWTVGALSAVYCSAKYPEFKSTALLLSGLVNAFAAIAFSVWVDPQAALITDETIKGERGHGQVHAAALHLAAGNCLGALLGLAVLPVGIQLIGEATQKVGAQGGHVAGSIWLIVAINAGLTLLASTTYAARVSAVLTRQVATALAIYNFFFLVSRLSGQVYSPLLGSTADHLVQTHQVDQLERLFRTVIGGASLGALLGLLLLPTFVEVINKAITQVQKHGSLPAVLLRCLHPFTWPAIIGCLRPPGLLGVRPAQLKKLPQLFLFANVAVLSIHTMGMMAAIHAGAVLHDNPGAAGSATLLSSVVNGVATILLGILVDPTLSRITDKCTKGEREVSDIKTAAVFLLGGMLLGTLLSQLLFTPASWLIRNCATLLAAALH